MYKINKLELINILESMIEADSVTLRVADYKEHYEDDGEIAYFDDRDISKLYDFINSDDIEEAYINSKANYIIIEFRHKGFITIEII